MALLLRWYLSFFAFVVMTLGTSKSVCLNGLRCSAEWSEWSGVGQKRLRPVCWAAVSHISLPLFLSLSLFFVFFFAIDLIYRSLRSGPESRHFEVFLHFPCGIKNVKFHRVLPGFVGLNWVFLTYLLGFTRFYWIEWVFTAFYWVLPGFHGCYWVLLDVCGGFTTFYWVLPGFNGFYIVWLGFTRFLGGFTWFYMGFEWVSFVLLGSTGFSWVLLGFIKLYWVLLGFNGFY